MKPFNISIDPSKIRTITNRVKETNWPLADDASSWSNGTSLKYMKEIAKYWANEYDWNKIEGHLNTFDHYTTTIDGTNIHFIYEPGELENAPTIVLLHGWPDSFYRFHLALPLFKKHYNVVVPSLPGFAFSGGAAKTSEETADILNTLVEKELGKKSYYVAAGDTGAPIAIQMAKRYPTNVDALYLTDVGYDTIGIDRSIVSDIEKEYLGYLDTWMMSEGAYAMVHTTKPQSLSFGLSDSPIGFAAWSASFANAGKGDDYVDTAFGGRDNFITNMMIYLVTNTINSSLQTYREGVILTKWGEDTATEQCPVPVALSTYPNDTYIPKEWAQRNGLNIQSYKQMPKGGHFAPLEIPNDYVDDVLSCFAAIGNK